MRGFMLMVNYEGVMTTLRTARLFRIRILPILAAVGLCFCGIATVHAQNQSSAISRGFETKETEVVQGALVSTTRNGSAIVELADIGSADRLAGVISEASLVELSDTAQGEVQVTLSGTTQALVTDLNGDIRAGDKITASPLRGVGMLATEDTQIVGTAQSAFVVKNGKTRTITDKSGQKHTVNVGYIPLLVGISYYAAPTSQFVPPFLQSLANSIAGRPVSLMRILLSCLLLLLAFGSIFVLIYTSVRSGLISLGRNPLAASAIQRSLIGVVIVILLVVVLSLVGVYLILTT